MGQNVRTFQNAFVSGELSPTAIGRFDKSLFLNGAGLIRNVYITSRGGVFRREGMAYQANTRNDEKGRLVSFEFNNVQDYLLNFTPGAMQVFKDGVLQTTVTSSPISNLTADIIAEMNWTQSADTLLLFHEDLEPIKINRITDVSWTAVNQSFTNIPVFPFSGITESNPAGTIQPDRTNGTVTVTGVGTNFTSGAYEKQFLELPQGGLIFVETVNSTTELVGEVRIELDDTTVVANGDWKLLSGHEDVFSATRGWPRGATFFGGRLWLGGTKERPQTLLGSVIGDFFNLDEGTGLDDEGINYTLDDDTVNTILNIFAGRSLQIFTSGGEFAVKSSLGDPITPAKIATQVSKETRHGSSRVRPITIDGGTLFVEAGPDNDTSGEVVRQFLFSDTEQSFNATDISVLSDHLIRQPVTMAARRASGGFSSDFVYLVNNDGTMAVLNTLRDQELLAWCLFDTEGTIEDVAVVGREAYVITQRTIDSATVRFIEKLDPLNFMDASERATSGSPTTSWSGFAHLPNTEVRVRGDGFILANATVDGSGNLTSSEEASELEVGLFFAGRIKSLPLSLIAASGQEQSGEFKRLVAVRVLVHESRNFVVKVRDKTYRPAFRQFGSDVLDEPVDKKSEWITVYVAGIDRETEVEITQEEPLEFNVLAIMYELEVSN